MNNNNLEIQALYNIIMIAVNHAFYINNAEPSVFKTSYKFRKA